MLHLFLTKRTDITCVTLLGQSRVVEGLDVFALPNDVEPLLGDIHDCHDIVPFVLFANQELVPGGERNSAALANETNECDVAL